MSQEYTTSRKQRRANRNRPVLVTSAEANGLSETETDSSITQEASTTVATETPTTIDKQSDPIAIPASPAPGQRPRRLPSFFPTIGKSDETAKEEKAEIAQARIARATRSKAASGSTSKVAAVTSDQAGKATATSKPVEKATARAASRPTGRPNSTFKTRYIFGMVIYLIVAQFVGVFITGLFQGAKIDSILLRFALFGGNVVIRTSTLVYLAILVILLVLLARFDLLPRSLGAMSGTSPNRSSASNSSNGESRKLPTTRQGVQGADDDLYQQYRSNQRKKK